MSETKPAIHQGSQFQKIFVHGRWYLISSILSKGVGFFLLPIYTHYLTPEDYGILASIESFAKLLPIFISLYIDTAFGRYYYLERAISKENVRQLYSTHFWFVVIWGGIASLGAFYLATVLFKKIFALGLWIVLIVIASQLLTQLGIMVIMIWKAELKAKQITFLQLGMLIIPITITLILLIPYQMGFEARIYARGIGALLQFFILIYIALQQRWLAFSFDWKIIKRSLIFSIPLIPNIAAGWIAGFSDRIILAHYGYISEAGLYSVAFQFAKVLYMINDALTQVQGPIAMSALTEDRESAKKQIAEFVSIFIWVIMLFYLGLTFFSKEVLYFFTNERFHETYKLIAILAGVYVVGGIYRIFTSILSFHAKNWVISSGAILAALLNIALNFTFIPYFGMYAAAWATLLNIGLYAFWLLYWSQRYDPIALPKVLILTVLSTSMVLLFLQQTLEQIESVNLWLVLVIKISLLALFFVPVFLVKAMQPIREKIVDVYYSIINRKS
ncbi:MAG: hypothetical protein B6247_18305 [Candidatus Parabeggiatoa sp. nov. 2]|nr:MAG: hypothetical protein B6247_18305 [Beggiatoa sp. 4572_84]